MNQFKERANSIVSQDPLAKHRKGVNAHQFYGLLCAIPVLFLVSLIFYIIASIEYELYFKADEEVTVLSKSLDKIIEKRDGQGKAEKSSKHEDERYVVDGSSLDQISIGMKLVPNMDQHNFLLKRMQLVGGTDSGYNGLEASVEYDMKAMGDPNEFIQFYEWNGAQHMTFPTLNFDANQIPYGDSVDMCLGV
jgi:hypothetical protein